MLRSVLAYGCAAYTFGIRHRNSYNAVRNFKYAYGRFYRLYVP